jgi:hypothetical protein
MSLAATCLPADERGLVLTPKVFNSEARGRPELSKGAPWDGFPDRDIYPAGVTQSSTGLAVCNTFGVTDKRRSLPSVRPSRNSERRWALECNAFGVNGRRYRPPSP